MSRSMRSLKRIGPMKITNNGLHVAALLSLGLLAACDNSAAKPAAAPPPPPVTVAKPVIKEIVEVDDFTGRFDATASVELRARVNGYLESIHFTRRRDRQGRRPAVRHRPSALSGHPGAGGCIAGLDARAARIRAAGAGPRRAPGPQRQRTGALARRTPPAIPVGAGRRQRRARRACSRRASTSGLPRSARRSPGASAASWSPRATSSGRTRPC